jgi:hypothetical protein
MRRDGRTVFVSGDREVTPPARTTTFAAPVSSSRARFRFPHAAEMLRSGKNAAGGVTRFGRRTNLSTWPARTFPDTGHRRRESNPQPAPLASRPNRDRFNPFEKGSCHENCCNRFRCLDCPRPCRRCRKRRRYQAGDGKMLRRRQGRQERMRRGPGHELRRHLEDRLPGQRLDAGQGRHLHLDQDPQGQWLADPQGSLPGRAARPAPGPPAQGRAAHLPDRGIPQ